MILTVCLSPSIDVTVELDALEVGKTNVAKRKRIRAAGKALNVANIVSRLGGEAYTTGFMYEKNSEMFEEMLQKNGVKHSFVQNPGRVRENYKFIDRRSMLTEVNDIGGEVTLENKLRLIDKVKELSKSSEVVVLSGGIPRGLDESYYADILKAVAPNAIKVVDATGNKLQAALKVGVDLVKPNLDELENTIGRQVTTREEILEGCRELISKGAKAVLLSMGKDGAILTNGTRSYYCKTKNVAVNSTVGAGDSMLAGAVISMVKGASMPEILRAGVAAGTAAVTTFDESEFPIEKYYEIYNFLQVTDY